MADAGVAISWGAPVRGREQQGLGVFAEVNAYYEKAKSNGEIEDFEVLLFEAGGPINGSFYLFGTCYPDFLLLKSCSSDYLLVFTGQGVP